MVRNARERELRKHRSLIERVDGARRRIADQREASRRKRRKP
jgi:hypothetical protein